MNIIEAVKSGKPFTRKRLIDKAFKKERDFKDSELTQKLIALGVDPEAFSLKVDQYLKIDTQGYLTEHSLKQEDILAEDWETKDD